MPHKPPIGRRELRKRGLLDEKKFFKELQSYCNFVDEETVRRFYTGVVKTVTKQLRDDGVCRLPHLGDFALVPQKSKSMLTGKIRQVRPALVLKFYPKAAWRQYFSARTAKKWDEGTLMPNGDRE